MWLLPVVVDDLQNSIIFFFFFFSSLLSLLHSLNIITKSHSFPQIACPLCAIRPSYLHFEYKFEQKGIATQSRRGTFSLRTFATKFPGFQSAFSRKEKKKRSELFLLLPVVNIDVVDEYNPSPAFTTFNHHRQQSGKRPRSQSRVPSMIVLGLVTVNIVIDSPVRPNYLSITPEI